MPGSAQTPSRKRWSATRTKAASSPASRPPSCHTNQDHLSLVQADDRLGWGIVIGIPDAAHDGSIQPQPDARCSESTSTGRFQRVVATRPRGCESSSSLKASDGVLQPRVFRGRWLSVAATAATSLALCLLRSVPLGKYWRSRPLVFSLVPRCHGLRGSQKNTCSQCRPFPSQQQYNRRYPKRRPSAAKSRSLCRTSPSPSLLDR